MVSALMLIFTAVALIKSVNCLSDPNCTFSNGSHLTPVPFYVCRNYLSLPQNLTRAGEALLLEMKENSNILQTLKNGDLVNTGMLNLTKLYLNHCGVEKIELGAFKGGKLSVLGLNFNRIEFLDLEVFKDLPDLELLGLEGNPLKSFGNQEFPRMNLIELHLGSCGLAEVKGGLLQNLQNLKKLRLQKNQLKTLNRKVFPKSLSVVLLQDNPWHCDCKIKFLLDYLDLHLVTWKTPEIIPECSSAATGTDLVGVNWADVNRSILYCPPMIQMLQYSHGFEAETFIELQCQFSGYPEPNVTWKKNGQLFKYGNSERNVVNETDGKEPYNFIETLVLPEPDLEGIYECNANSIAGSDRLEIKVEIVGTASDGLILPTTTPFNIQPKKKHFWDRVEFKVLMGIILALVVLSGFYLLNRLINKHFPEKTYNEVSMQEEQIVPEVLKIEIIGNPPKELRYYASPL